MKKILFIFGTRPEAIKMAPLITLMKKRKKRFKAIVCVTGQHKQMLKQVLEVFSIKPDFDLKIMKKNQDLAQMSGSILQKVGEVVRQTKPDLVMVQGDTTTALFGAIAAYYRKVPVAHVEAGLRTGDFQNPFPEEFNRVLIDQFAKYCFAPTSRNKKALIRENIAKEKIFVTGNTGIDALLMTKKRLPNFDKSEWRKHWPSLKQPVNKIRNPIILLTIHRRESFGKAMQEIFKAIKKLALMYPKCVFIYPVHLNPNVRKPAQKILKNIENIFLINPLPYEPFVFLMNKAALILTDSGGVQEEAPSLDKPVLVLRKTTERQEAVDAGTVKLIGNTGRGIQENVSKILLNLNQQKKSKKNPYGDGRASIRILSILEKKL